MKKYILLFVVASFFGLSHAIAQSQATTGQKQAAAVTVSPGTPGNNSRETIVNTDRNQQSVYVPSSNDTGKVTNAPASQQALPAQTQPAVIDPKKQY